MLVNQNWGK